MKIESVSVCINYGDYLRETLPYNLQHFESFVVVTSPEDEETQSICRKWNVRCVVTDVHRRDQGSKFNKSRAINHGLNHLTRKEWLVHLDADIVLPAQFRRLIENAELQQDCVYGVDRVNCPNYAEWQRYRQENIYKQDVSWFAYPPFGWKVGTRLVHGDYGGWVPIGYFQMWHSSARIRYPITIDGDAEHSDVLHGVEWERTKRILLPEFYAIHLTDGAGKPMGVNWSGRKSPRFGPESENSLKSRQYET